MQKDDIQKQLIERYMSTGLVGFTKPKDINHAVALIESVMKMYDDVEDSQKVLTLAEISEKFKEILNF